MSAITLVSATVKYPAGKTFDTQYGQRINVVLALPDGTEHKEWSHPDDRFLRSLKKGDAVQVVKDGDRCKLLKAEDDLPPPLPANNHPPPPPRWALQLTPVGVKNIKPESLKKSSSGLP